MRTLLFALAFPLGLAAMPAQALEPFNIYDRFTDRTIDAARWSDTEKVREIKGGAMRLMQRTYGLSSSNTGATPTNWQSNIAPVSPLITALKATITVTALETTDCLGVNPAAGDARARIIGSFFNTTGTSSFPSQVNDAIAQVRLYRASTSTDPQGQLRVQGILSICSTSDCNSAATVGDIVDLGTVMVGTPTTVAIQWDKPGKTFHFSREGVTGGTVAYSVSDDFFPSVIFRQVSTRVLVPSCQSAPRAGAVVDALFDNVFVNRSAP